MISTTQIQTQTKTKLCEGVCNGIACSYCWSFKIPKHILNATTNISIDDDDEHVPLTISSSNNDHAVDINKQPSSFVGDCNTKSNNSLLNNNHLSYTSDLEDDNEDSIEEDIDVAHANTKQPRKFRLLGNWQNNRQQAQSRYDGYSTIGGRVSMHDTWDDKDEDDNSTNREDGVKDGEFISYWERGDDNSDDSSFCSTDKQINLLESDNGDGDDDDNDDDRVETTMRPIPLFQRRSGRLGSNTIHPSSPKQFGWFQRELEDSVYDNNNNNIDRHSRRRRRRGPWGWLRRKQAALEHEFDNSEDEGDHNIEENVLLDSSTCSDENGHYIMTPDMSEYDRALSNAESNVKMAQNNNIFGNNRRDRRGILASPIVRPFLRERSSPRGYMDNVDILEEGDDRGEDDKPSSQDHAAIKQSITQGISGTNDNTLLLDANDVLAIDDKQSNRNRPPNLIERIFITRFLQSPEGEDNRNDLRKIRQLHRLLRRENWNMAQNLLESNPDLARRWHNVDRLYGGRYDGEVLPIHAACALHPPSSFIKMLGNIYPEGLLEKDKSFGRVPLAVACRSLADSSVIRILCDMEPQSIDARDSLKRVPLHYLIKNYTAFGNDDDDIPNIDEDNEEEEKDTKESDSSDETNVKSDEDGMNAMLIIIKSNPNCLHAADHRGWLPLHVACSCSSRKGMLRVLRLLLKVNPESINCTTDKKSDVFDCVNMAGKHHPTKDETIAILKEAKSLVEDEESGSAGENIEDELSNSSDNNSDSSQVSDEHDDNSDDNGDDDDSLEDSLSNPQAQVVDLLLPDEEALSQNSSYEESEDRTESSCGESPEVHCPEAVLINI